MNLLLDTNILLHLSKKSNLDKIGEIINPENKKTFASIVSLAELRSLVLQNNWGEQKLQSLYQTLEEITIVEINENLVSTYAEIDAFSQRKNQSYSTYSFSTPRNMGKNDLWIASTAALLGLKVVTTDGDFNHLHDVFINVLHLKPEQLRAY